MLPEYVWDAGVLEGNPFTFPEVKTLLDGVTVGGRKLSDQEQILNLAQSSKPFRRYMSFFSDGNKRTDFYTSRDPTEMMAFVLECHPEISQIRQLNPGLPAAKDLPNIEYFRLSDSLTQRN